MQTVLLRSLDSISSLLNGEVGEVKLQLRVTDLGARLAVHSDQLCPCQDSESSSCCGKTLTEDTLVGGEGEPRPAPLLLRPVLTSSGG